MNKFRILIIDDDPHLRKTLSDILKITGYETLVAESGNEGLSLLKNNPVNVVLTDLGLPDIHGLEVLAKVKADYPAIEAIIVTGQGALDSAIEATNKGAFSYLVKPYQIEQLLLQIRRAIDKQQAEAEIVRHNQDLQQLNAELKALYDVSQAISRTLDLKELVFEILKALVNTAVFPFEIKGAIFLIEKGKMRLASFISIAESALETCDEVQMGKCLCGLAAVTGEIVVSPDSKEDERHNLCSHVGEPHGHVIVPLKAVNKVVGILALYTKPKTEVDENLLKLLSSLGDQIGIAINNAHLYEETKVFSLHDPLTGLANRRFLEIQIDKSIEAAIRYQSELSVIMIDIDFFKQYNDTRGHLEGDKLIAKLAKIFMREARLADYVFRYGGEEFFIILPEASLEAAFIFAERLRKMVEQENDVTISLGVASLETSEPKKEALIGDADKALYQAKQRGRNRTELAGS